MIGTSDQSCWLAEACKILLFSLTCDIERCYALVTPGRSIFAKELGNYLCG